MIRKKDTNATFCTSNTPGIPHDPNLIQSIMNCNILMLWNMHVFVSITVICKLGEMKEIL